MIQNLDNTEKWEDKVGHTKKLGISKLVSPHLFISCPISLHSPSIHYNVYPFENFTLPPLIKFWVFGVLNLFTFMGVNETINNNQEDSKHKICFKY